MVDESEQYQQAYSEHSFWDKVKQFSLAAGREVVEKALILYYTLREPDVPAWARRSLVDDIAEFCLRGAGAVQQSGSRIREGARRYG